MSKKALINVYMYCERTGNSIQKIISDALTPNDDLESCQKIFWNLDLTAPKDEEILEALSNIKRQREEELAKAAAIEEAKTKAKKTVPRRSKKKETSSKPVTKEASNKNQSEAGSEKYFRRVVPAKKTKK